MPLFILRWLWNSVYHNLVKIYQHGQKSNFGTFVLYVDNLFFFSIALTVWFCVLPGNIESLYAFSYQADVDYPKSYGWDLFDTQTEFLRMGVPNDTWVQSNLNKEYEVSTWILFHCAYLAVQCCLSAGFQAIGLEFEACLGLFHILWQEMPSTWDCFIQKWAVTCRGSIWFRE